MKYIEMKSNSGCRFKKETSRKSRAKKGNVVLFLWLATILPFMTSCKSTVFYQFYKVNSINEFSKNSNSLVFEDDNCKVFYDFWGPSGDVGFMIYNKTDENIYVNKKESFFIENGMAYDYFKNRTYENSKSSSMSFSNSNMAMYGVTGMDAVGLGASTSVSGSNYQGFKQTNAVAAGASSAIAQTAEIANTKTKGFTTSSGYSVSYKEMDVICIPPKTSKIISEYCITNALYRDCDLRKYPSKSQIRTLKYTGAKSPYVFSNKIAYTVGKSKDLFIFDNKFYVSEITNYPKKSVMVEGNKMFCGEKSDEIYEFFNNYSPDSFYIQYDKGKDKHKY